MTALIIKSSYSHGKNNCSSIPISTILIPVKNQHITKNGICSSACNLRIQVPNKYQTNLFQQIKKRKQIGRLYSQEEVWFMANSIIGLASKIHETNKKAIFGNIHPNNILIDSFGQISCIGMLSLPKQKNNFDTFTQEKSFQTSYVSPQLIGFTKRGRNNGYSSCIDRHKVESYCAGLTLLSMATLSNLNGFFLTSDQCIQNQGVVLMNHSSRRHQFHNLINQTIEEDLLDKVFNRYSNVLHSLICSLLGHSPQQRADLTFINKNILEPNQGYIKSMTQNWAHNNELQRIIQRQEQVDQKQQSFYHKLNFSASKKKIPLDNKMKQKMSKNQCLKFQEFNALNLIQNQTINQEQNSKNKITLTIRTDTRKNKQKQKQIKFLYKNRQGP